jgi:hypothetical protein
MGIYSTAFNSYYSMANFGYILQDDLSFGPEIIAMGNESFDQQRYGIYLSGLDLGIAKMKISAGHAPEGRKSKQSAYGSITLSKNF